MCILTAVELRNICMHHNSKLTPQSGHYATDTITTVHRQQILLLLLSLCYWYARIRTGYQSSCEAAAVDTVSGWRVAGGVNAAGCATAGRTGVTVEGRWGVTVDGAAETTALPAPVLSSRVFIFSTALGRTVIIRHHKMLFTKVTMMPLLCSPEAPHTTGTLHIY